MNDIENSDAELGTDEKRREAIAAYYALCTFVDTQIGRVLDALEASGQAENTLVIYTSDHGEGWACVAAGANRIFTARACRCR